MVILPTARRCSSDPALMLLIWSQIVEALDIGGLEVCRMRRGAPSLPTGKVSDSVGSLGCNSVPGNSRFVHTVEDTVM